MIPERAIVEWGNFVPWIRAATVEQDLIICRAPVAIYSDGFLSSHIAFRGGTAIHKLYLSPRSRYSEDIDLVQIKPENSTFPPIMPLRLKIEINCKEHFSIPGFVKIPFEVNSQWFNGHCNITAYQLDELIGTKLRALYRRKKGRDLFDLYRALEYPNLNMDNVIKRYHRYIAFSDGESPPKNIYLANLDEKMQEEIFLYDTQAILRPSLIYNPQTAFEAVKTKLIEKLEL
jgi:predicted nucleotidyltransferase component of viral defense system